jgi:hypothetical protein
MKILACLAFLITTAAAQAAPSAPCSAPAHRQFDFWVGDCQVLKPGTLAGMNRITLEDGVRQLWESADAKGAWSVAFDGKYTKQ